MSPQIIFSDVDGTLLNSDHKVLPGTLYAIRELQDKGVPFVIISGRKVLLSFFIFLITLMMCVSGTFSYAEDEDYSQGFYQWQTIVAEKWPQFEKLDLDSGWFTGYRLPADVYAFFEMPYEQDDCCFLIKNSMHFQSHFKVSVHNRTVR